MYRSSTTGRRSGRVLLLVALFELALAGGSWLLAGFAPGGREGMLIAAGILGSTGIVLVVVAVVLLRRAQPRPTGSAQSAWRGRARSWACARPGY